MPLPASACPAAPRSSPGRAAPDGIGFATARLLGELSAALVISATSVRIEARASELRTADFDATGVVSAALRRWIRRDM
jgi:hypothetical protein